MRSDLKLKCGDAELDIVTAYDQVADLGVSACQADLRAIAARSIRRALHAEAECERLRFGIAEAADRLLAWCDMPDADATMRAVSRYLRQLLKEGNANG